MHMHIIYKYYTMCLHIYMCIIYIFYIITYYYYMMDYGMIS